MKILNLFKISNVFQIARCRNSTQVESLQAINEKEYIPRRTVLYMPGNDDRKLAKIPNINSDCIILDCEDGVAVSKKAEARINIHKYLEKKIGSTKDISVRFNSVDSGLCKDDMNTILSSTVLPRTLFLPKVDNTSQIKWFAEQLENCIGSRKLDVKFRLFMYVESAISLLNLYSICEKAIELSSQYPYILDGLVFGSDDFCADIGATRTELAKECLYSRQHIVAVAKAFKLQAIDLVYTNYKDNDGLKKQSIEGAMFGFTGKQVIHPQQVQTVLEAFTPSTEKIKWATELISSFEKHQSDGKGAMTFEGNMIDMPLVLQARNILKMASK